MYFVGKIYQKMFIVLNALNFSKENNYIHVVKCYGRKKCKIVQIAGTCGLKVLTHKNNGKI